MKTTRWLAAILVVVLVAVALRLTVLTPEPVAVRVAVVERGAVEEAVANSRAGTVKARRRARLSPQTGGLVVGLPHREGEQVEEGDLLLELDDRAQQAELELASRAVEASEAQEAESCLAADLAEKELRRGTDLHVKGFASDQSLDTLRTQRDRSRAGCRAASAALEQARARVDAAGIQVAFTRLEAPFGGVVAEVSTEVGEWITPSPPGVPIPPVIDLLDPRSLYVSAPIDEVDSARVQPGQPARVTVDSHPGVSLTGSVTRVAPYVLDDLEQNRTVEVEVELDERPEGLELLPGTSADVEIILARRADVLRVPASAVAEDQTVLVLDDGLLVDRQVEIGLRDWEWAEILGGLQAGERVVVSRLDKRIRPGARADARSE